MTPIDNRLQACADFVTQNGTVCDVGTDHAYLVAYLVSSGKCKSAIAADINDGPLAAARQTLEKFGIKDSIKVIKSDGLQNVMPGNITDVVIAGMGAELIAEIISKADWLKNGVNLILQPMTRVSYLRKWLYSNGYAIVEEKAIRNEKFIYSIMKVRYFEEIIEIDEVAANIGKMILTDLTARAYCEKQAERLEKAGLGIQKSANNSADNEMLITAQRIRKLLEVQDDNS